MDCVTIFLLFVLYNTNYVIGKNGVDILQKDTNANEDDFSNLILEILLNTLLPYKCVAMITDDVYYYVFKDTLFKKFGIYLSFFVIYVQESEDLLSPYNKTQKSLLQIKYDDCQTYIILISNGQQVSRLLRYGDRYRVLDTRAKFIMLHDHRLFHKSLHYLWKRIVNVIFIKEYVGMKKSGRTTVAIPWFEISTVPFPSPIQNIFVAKRLDIWRKSKFRSGVNLFQDKTRDLKNQTLSVVVITHTPATTKMSLLEEHTVRAVMGDGSKGFAGLEVEILAAVSKAMNFKCALYEAPNADVEFWGRQQPGGQYTGLIGEMIRNKADIALGDLYYTSYVLELMDLTVPYNAECLTFLTPESLTDNSWKTLILPFNVLMWLAVIFCLFFCGVVFHYLSLFHCNINELKMDAQKPAETLPKKKQVLTLPAISVDQKNYNSKYFLMKQQFVTKREENDPEGLHLFSDFFNSMLYTYSMLVMVSLPKLPTGWSLRMLVGWYWLYCTLVVVSYRASMTAILANPAPRVTIDTLQELVNSKLSYGGWSEVNKDLFKTSSDPVSQTIGSNFQIISNSTMALEQISEGKFALYDNAYFLKEAAVVRQLQLQSSAGATEVPTPAQPSNKPNERRLHVMENCAIYMPISIGLQKNSPIKPRADKYIRRVLEAGLIKKWLDDVMQPTLNAEIPSTLQTTKALMSMQKFIGAIVALLIGYFLGLAALCAEIIYFHYAVKKHPNFNRYSRRIHE